MTQQVDSLTIQHRKNLVFRAVEAAAIAGARCPFNDQLPAPSSILTALCRDGKLLVEVYDRNWRVVTILEGPHKGLTTKRCPRTAENWTGSPRKPYVTVDTKGTFRNGKPVVGNHRGGEKPVTLAFKGGKRNREVF